jgi:DNA repair protein RecN (Recombination protein N)
MLRRLHIRNYLLIEELDLTLSDGLTVITGETGSGKSILIGALALAMGERAGTGTARDPHQRCVVELEVDLLGTEHRAWFEQHELPFEEPTILRRQVDPGGRSRAFINDTPVRIELLRELGERSVHIHSQHHTLLLNDPRFQLGLLDHVAGTRSLLRPYSDRYEAWCRQRRDLEHLQEQDATARAEVDFLQFQWSELEQVRLQTGELELLGVELERAEHAQEIQHALQHLEATLTNERGLLDQLASARVQLAKVARVDQGVSILLDRVQSVQIELKDLAHKASSLASTVDLEPGRTERLRLRSDELNRLLQKHRMERVEELIALRDGIAERLSSIGSLEERVAILKKEEAEAASVVTSLAETLSTARANALASLSGRIEALLHDLGMPDARLRFQHQRTEPGPQGIDAIRAMFTANKDRAPAALDKVASGGELARVMLALISLAADSQGLRTVIFDEIDTGVSGEVADRVGALMTRMGKDRQVLAITHLPQIASKGQQHLLVTKIGSADGVRTDLITLNAEERIHSIAQMLSGRKVTKQALENARVLLETTNGRQRRTSEAS